MSSPIAQRAPGNQESDRWPTAQGKVRLKNGNTHESRNATTKKEGQPDICGRTDRYRGLRGRPSSQPVPATHGGGLSRHAHRRLTNQYRRTCWDDNYFFLDWNTAFDEWVASPLGLCGDVVTPKTSFARCRMWIALLSPLDAPLRTRQRASDRHGTSRFQVGRIWKRGVQQNRCPDRRLRCETHRVVCLSKHHSCGSLGQIVGDDRNTTRARLETGPGMQSYTTSCC